MPALTVGLDVVHQRRDRVGAVVERNDETERWGHRPKYITKLRILPRTRHSQAAPRTPLLSPCLARTSRVRGGSPPNGRSSGGTLR